MSRMSHRDEALGLTELKAWKASDTAIGSNRGRYERREL